MLPDYELPLTYNEVTMGADGETDVMLEYALQLIADGKYLSEEDPFDEPSAQLTTIVGPSSKDHRRNNKFKCVNAL